MSTQTMKIQIQIQTMSPFVKSVNEQINIKVTSLKPFTFLGKTPNSHVKCMCKRVNILLYKIYNTCKHKGRQSALYKVYRSNNRTGTLTHKCIKADIIEVSWNSIFIKCYQNLDYRVNKYLKSSLMSCISSLLTLKVFSLVCWPSIYL